MSGFFITFEGGEGSGKTSQINRLAQHLTEHKQKVITTREPGGTEEAEKIRDFLVQRDGGDWAPMAECLLLYAARYMNVQDVIRPALDDGKIVISDRFYDSTFAYQGYGHGFPLDKIETLNDLVLLNLKPNLTFILDIDPEEGIARSQRRLTAEAIGFEQNEDRFENLDISFHQRLREGFLDIAKNNPDRCVVIDATQDMDAITQQLIDETMERLA